MKPRSFFFIETQFDNLGDALINREMIRLMAERSEVTLGVSRVPESFKDMIGRDFLARFTLDETRGRSAFLLAVARRALRGERCFVFLSPGGWIGELDGNLNLRSWLHTFLYYLLRLFGARVCQLGVSYEDPGPKLRLLLRGRSGALYRHFVRDEASRAVMQKAGVRIDGLCPDLAFNAFDGAQGKGEGATFSFRADQYKGQIDDIRAFLAFYFETFGTEKPVFFVAQVEKDVAANRELAAWVSARTGIPAPMDDVCASVELAQNAYRRTAVIVSNRLHALLLAGSVGNAMIAAPVGQANKKIRALFADSGCADSVFAAPGDADRLRRAAARLYDGKREREALAARFDEIFAAGEGS